MRRVVRARALGCGRPLALRGYMPFGRRLGFLRKCHCCTASELGRGFLSSAVSPAGPLTLGATLARRLWLLRRRCARTQVRVLCRHRRGELGSTLPLPRPDSFRSTLCLLCRAALGLLDVVNQVGPSEKREKKGGEKRKGERKEFPKKQNQGRPSCRVAPFLPSSSSLHRCVPPEGTSTASCVRVWGCARPSLCAGLVARPTGRSGPDALAARAWKLGLLCV